jgi:hypothetical protein
MLTPLNSIINLGLFLEMKISKLLQQHREKQALELKRVEENRQRLKSEAAGRGQKYISPDGSHLNDHQLFLEKSPKL